MENLGDEKELMQFRGGEIASKFVDEGNLGLAARALAMKIVSVVEDSLSSSSFSFESSLADLDTPMRHIIEAFETY